MACCGKSRIQYHTETQNNPASAAEAPVRPPSAAAPIRFEYVGGTGMSVRGPITGRTYRFGNAGAHVAVDPRDAPSLMAVPRLRTVGA
jgi:hypothetical protein